MHRCPLACTAALALACFLSPSVHATAIEGAVWCADDVADCGADTKAGLPRIEGVTLGLCDAEGNPLLDGNGDPLIRVTDTAGRYRFAGLGSMFPGMDVFIVKVLEGPVGKELGAINCLNTQVDRADNGCLGTDIPFLDICGEKDVALGQIVIDMTGVEDTCQRSISQIDFAYCTVVCDGEIGDLVWLDEDGDGVKDDNENGINDVVLHLSNADGHIATTTTAGGGLYLFSGLCAGDYTVTIDEGSLPDGLLPCAEGLGDNRTSPASVTLSANDSSDLTVDFCYFVEPVLGGQGCTPGFWKQAHHFHHWPAGVTPSTLFSDVFEDAFPGKTLLQVLRQGGWRPQRPRTPHGCRAAQRPLESRVRHECCRRDRRFQQRLS